MKTLLILNKNRGFSLTELMIVIAMIGIIGTIATFGWQRYVNNSNLRTAARDIVSDFQYYKAKSISENREYSISFTTGSASGYIVSALATATHEAVNRTKYLSEYGNGIQITNVVFAASDPNSITFQPRGTISGGNITLSNALSSTAAITTNITGKSFVEFSIH